MTALEAGAEQEAEQCPHGRRQRPDAERGIAASGIGYCGCCGNTWNARIRPGKRCGICLEAEAAQRQEGSNWGGLSDKDYNRISADFAERMRASGSDPWR